MEQDVLIPNIFQTVKHKQDVFILARRIGDDSVTAFLEELFESVEKNKTLKALALYKKIKERIRVGNNDTEELLDILYYHEAKPDGRGGYDFTWHPDPQKPERNCCNLEDCWHCCDKCQDMCDCCC